jgi:urease accessory protein
MPAAAMATDSLLKLLAWLSPSFPVGAFAYSHGLETAIEDGLVRDRATLEGWIADLVASGGPRADATFLAHVWQAVTSGDVAAFREAAELAGAMRGTAELALESVQQGESFLQAMGDAWPVAVAPWRAALADAAIRPAYPVAVGIAAAAAGVPLAATLAAYLHAFAANLVSAAVRAVPLGQTDGQRVLAALERHVAAAAEAAVDRPLEEAGGAAVAVDILSFRHETQYTRIFRS